MNVCRVGPFFGLAGIVLALCAVSLWPTGVASAQVPRMSGAVWIIDHYLSNRQTLTAVRPDVVVCSEGIPGEWLAGISAWVGNSSELRYASSIAMRNGCTQDAGGLDTLYIRSVTPVVDSFVGYLEADIHYGKVREVRRFEEFGAAPTTMFRFNVAIERADSAFWISADLPSHAEAIWRYLTVRGNVLSDNSGRWVVICDARVAVSEVNKYVADALRYYRLPVTLDHGCQIPSAVQEDTTRFVLMVDQVDVADTGVTVVARRLGARYHPVPRTETFRMLTNGDAQLLLDRFVRRAVD